MKKKATPKKAASRKPKAAPAKKGKADTPRGAAKAKGSPKAGAKAPALPSPDEVIGDGPLPLFMRPLTPDAALAALVGPDPRPRTELVRATWAYVRRKGLLDAENKDRIVADEALRSVLDERAEIVRAELPDAIDRHAR